MSFLRSSKHVVTNIVTGIVASIGLLSCDFIDSETVEPIRVTYPSYQQTYQQGDRNSYEFIAGTNQDILNGSLEMLWETSFVPLLIDPFTTIPTDLPVVKFTGTVTFGGIQYSAIQYITQSTAAADEGSMFLHAFDDNNTGTATDFWVEGSTPLVSLGNAQTIYSPYQPDATTPGEKDRTRNNIYKVMGNCTPTSCQEIASVSDSFTVLNEPLVVIDTVQGSFETYKVFYRITVLPTAPLLFPLTSVLDYRTTCHDANPKKSDSVSAEGFMWVHPNIGPIRIENTCTSGPIITSYTALLSLTSLPTN